MDDDLGLSLRVSENTCFWQSRAAIKSDDDPWVIIILEMSRGELKRVESA
jgi:hypothetical protein